MKYVPSEKTIEATSQAGLRLERLETNNAQSKSALDAR